MEIVNFSGGFKTRYFSGRIKESVAYYDTNSVWFNYFSGEINEVMLPAQIEIDSYNSQFGINVTRDGRYFFIQSWDRNKIYCFRITDCRKMWDTKIRHPYGLCVHDEFLICYAMHDGVYRIELDKGTVVAHYKCTYTRFFRFLNNSLFLIGPIKNEYKIMNFDFKQLSAIPIGIANPNQYDTFLITEAALQGKSVVLAGFEYNSIDLCGLTYQQQEQMIENSRFSREIELRMLFSYM